jgi:hypothetical protein
MHELIHKELSPKSWPEPTIHEYLFRLRLLSSRIRVMSSAKVQTYYITSVAGRGISL